MWQKFLKGFFGKNGHRSILQGKKILIIEDGEGERRFIIRTLEKKGCSVLVASEGMTGIQLAKTENPDLILLDYVMPGIDGREVCVRLKNDETTKSIPIIFLTGSVTPKNVIDCYEAGAEYYLSKPIDSRMLAQQVEMTLQYTESELSS